jgi:hypothetical protein
MPARVEFFKNRLLRISPRSALNDPYDSHPFSSDLDKPIEIYVAVGKGHIYKEPRKAENHLNGTGVISFTEVVDNILMWSHYGNSHKGVAVEFDPKHDYFHSIQRVRYTTQRPDLRTQYSEIMAPELYFKSDQWMYEKEWRLVKSNPMADCVLDSKTKVILPMSHMTKTMPPTHFLMSTVPSDAIKSVFFGCMAAQEEIDEISKIIQTTPEIQHVNCYKTRLNPDKFELIFKTL